MTIELILYPLIGILSGFLAGFFGVGGGLVIVPALHFLYVSLGYSDDVSIPLALGTAMSCIIINALSAIPIHNKNKAINWSNFTKLVIGISIGSLGGAYLSVESDKDLFKNIFALFIFLISLRMFFKFKEPKTKKNIPTYIAVPFGSFVGTVSSAFAIGGGIFIGPFLKIMGESMKRAVGTSVACTLPVSIFGASAYLYLGLGAEGLPDYSIGYVNYLSLGCIVIFSSFSSRFGANMVQKVDEKVFQTLYALQLLPIFIYWLLA
jgi:uncharacterized membrane protein YfcA